MSAKKIKTTISIDEDLWRESNFVVRKTCFGKKVINKIDIRDT